MVKLSDGHTQREGEQNLTILISILNVRDE
jgi:hypothetical protein